jgi:hypothetical protein
MSYREQFRNVTLVPFLGLRWESVFERKGAAEAGDLDEAYFAPTVIAQLWRTVCRGDTLSTVFSRQ